MSNENERDELRALAEAAREVGWPSLRTPSPDRITALLDDLDAAERECREALARWSEVNGRHGEALASVDSWCEEAGIQRRRAERAEAQVAAVRALCGDNAWFADFGEPPNEDVVPGVRESDLLAALDTPADTPTEPDTEVVYDGPSFGDYWPTASDAGPECDLCGETGCPDADLLESSEPVACTLTPIYNALRYDRCEYGCGRDVTKTTIRRDIAPAIRRIIQGVTQ